MILRLPDWLFYPDLAITVLGLLAGLLYYLLRRATRWVRVLLHRYRVRVWSAGYLAGWTERAEVAPCPSPSMLVARLGRIRAAQAAQNGDIPA